ncbi:hypothetical protein [Tychonema sp. LEGE 07203]|nr:hypothetical protein [Tychonema sp. LEGE 07203]
MISIQPRRSLSVELKEAAFNPVQGDRSSRPLCYLLPKQLH